MAKEALPDAAPVRVLVSNAEEKSSYTVNEFYTRYHISRSTYYKLKREGYGPVELRAGTRALRITFRAAHEWESRYENRAANDDIASNPHAA